MLVKLGGTMALVPPFLPGLFIVHAILDSIPVNKYIYSSSGLPAIAYVSMPAYSTSLACTISTISEMVFTILSGTIFLPSGNP